MGSTNAVTTGASQTLSNQSPVASTQSSTPTSNQGASSGDGQCSDRGGLTYHLDWKAEGVDFFKEWNYLLNDPNSGAAQYMPREKATELQMTVGHDTHAIMRSGPKG